MLRVTRVRSLPILQRSTSFFFNYHLVFPIHVIVYWEHTRSYLKVPFQVQKENTFTAQILFILGANCRYIDNLQNIVRWFTSKLFWNSKFNFGPFFFNLGPFKAKSRLPIKKKKNNDVYAFCSIGLSNKLFFPSFFPFSSNKVWNLKKQSSAFSKLIHRTYANFDVCVTETSLGRLSKNLVSPGVLTS